MDDVVLAKAAVIERCIGRAREEHGGDDTRLDLDIVRSIITHGLGDLGRFAAECLRRYAQIPER